MKRVLTFCTIVLISFLLRGCQTEPTHEPAPVLVPSASGSTSNISKVCLENNVCIQVEIADEGKEWQQGLMKREQMGALSGMLFVFPNMGAWAFWMKDTVLPLDMLRLDGSGAIVHIVAQAPSCLTESCPTYGPAHPVAKYVLEVHSGVVAAYALQTGMKATITY